MLPKVTWETIETLGIDSDLKAIQRRAEEYMVENPVLFLQLPI